MVLNEKDQCSSRIFPSFAVCCAGGKVRLSPLLRPPPYLMNLYTLLETEAVTFRTNVRSYNSLLACTSFGANVNGKFQSLILLFMVKFIILLVHYCQLKGKHLNLLNYTFITL